mmetsp:Transcript_51144/g.153665  ORF Transcript_51144/g.153665 Transcript_51144/m.153665 type:complete len:114 (-) Transcript_51144:875-1216(-)
MWQINNYSTILRAVLHISRSDIDFDSPKISSNRPMCNLSVGMAIFTSSFHILIQKLRNAESIVEVSTQPQYWSRHCQNTTFDILAKCGTVCHHDVNAMITGLTKGAMGGGKIE